MKIVFLGPPGAGKGTYAKRMSKDLSIPTISTGNILRASVKKGTPVGLRAKEHMENGTLVPDDIVVGLVKKRLAKEDCKNGCILDGMPRTIAQAETLELSGIKVDAAILLEVETSIIEARLKGRRSCPACGATFHISGNPPKEQGKCDFCGAELIIRKDDQPVTIQQRLKVYHTQTEPLIKFYEDLGRLTRVNGGLLINEVMPQIYRVLGI